MKKSILLFAICAAVLSGFSATLLTINDPKSGKVTTIGEKSSGKLSSVDVFSENENGTFKLSRIFSTDVYTNAYDITHTCETNETVTPVYGSDFVIYRESDNAYFTNTIVAHRPNTSENTTFYYWTDNVVTDMVWQSYENSWRYTHDQNVQPGENYYLDYDKIECIMWNNTLRTFTTNDVPFGITKVFDVRAYNYSTNYVHSYVTNSFWPVFKNTLVVTNEIFDAACSNHCFHASPSPDVYLFKGDKVIFNGTATGGAHRLVIE